MKKHILFIFLLSSPFIACGQGILESITNDLRLDTLISIDTEMEPIPLTIIKGKNAGPSYTLIAAIHGYEYPPIIALQELLEEINPDKLNGTLIVLPVANIASFYGRSPFVNPVDKKNLNTAFPGSASGTATEKIAHWITKEIIPISDVFIDIHGGDANEDLIPFICFYDNKDEQTQAAKQLCEASEMPYIVSYPYTISKTEAAKYAFKQAVQDGKIALSIEAGKLGTVQNENVNLIKKALYNMLNFAKVYSKKDAGNSVKKSYFYNQTYVKVEQRGLFYSTFKSGDTVSKDQKIGYITDFFGKIIKEIIAPQKGVILYKIGTPPVNPGETLFCIAY